MDQRSEIHFSYKKYFQQEMVVYHYLVLQATIHYLLCSSLKIWNYRFIRPPRTRIWTGKRIEAIHLEVIVESVNPLNRTYSSALTQNCIRSPCKSLPLHVVCQLLSVKLLVSLDNSAFSWFCDLSERFFEQNNQISSVISNILRARK